MSASTLQFLSWFLTAVSGNQYPSLWTSTAVKELFEGKSESPSNKTNSSTTQSSQPHRLGHGAVAGIAVGCIAFVAIIVAAGATFTIKHKSRNPTPNKLSDGSQQASPAESQYMELSAVQRPKEILTEHRDRAELPLSHTAGRVAEEPHSRASIPSELPV